MFFGEPEFETKDFLRLTDDGRGIISLLELPNLQDRPALFSTFLMWLLADLFHDLPEEGDLDKPKLVFFFDEAHLLFNDASEAFLDQIAQTVRLIRSKGVGVFFVTQSPTDVPDEVLGQLGSRIQHQLRAHTPNDAKALKATVNTYPNSAYDDLGEVITSLGIGEAVVTVMNERGAPTPVAWTRLRAPESLMDAAETADMEAVVTASPLSAKYAEGDRPRVGPRAAGQEAGGGRAQGRRGRPGQGDGARAEERPRHQEGGQEGGEGRRRHGDGRGHVARLQGLHEHGGARDRAGDVQVRPPLSRRSGGVPPAFAARNVASPPLAGERSTSSGRARPAAWSRCRRRG